ncbi:MAG: XRE family transcriptional regulator [Rhodocyclales bacterium]|nr:XRE family transcriptional regulator [Rhodocyclales bacterium]
MTRGSGNVFADLGFDADEAQNLLLRSQTMMAVERWYKASGLTQAKAAQSLGITQPRLSQLLKGKIGEFSLDALVNMATRAGMRVGLTIKPVPGVKVARATKPKTEGPRKHAGGNVGRARKAA